MSKYKDADRLLLELSDLLDEFSELDENGLHNERWCGIMDAKCVIVNAPSIDIEPKQGEWIDKGWKGDWQFETDGRGNCWKAFECSNCNTTSKVQTNFCPNCGARMKGVDDGRNAD